MWPGRGGGTAAALGALLQGCVPRRTTRFTSPVMRVYSQWSPLWVIEELRGLAE